jgi:hypothetical protein
MDTMGASTRHDFAVVYFTHSDYFQAKSSRFCLQALERLIRTTGE